MKPEILHNDHMMFLDRALETQRTALLTAMADAVSECRTAADQAAELTETGETGLLRLVEILWELSSMAASLMLGEWFD